jgi:hypothetical protein
MLVPLLVETKETVRLAELTDGALTTNWAGKLLHASGSRTLQEGHPRQAARLWSAMGLPIVDAGRSKHYRAALDAFVARAGCPVRLPATRFDRQARQRQAKAPR